MEVNEKRGEEAPPFAGSSGSCRKTYCTYIYIYVYLFQYIYIYLYLFIYVSERVLGADLLELRMPRSHGSHLLVIFF